jgi:8-oxo-dGTP pyrophosphatase MutT (NUDIX family)
MDDSQKRYQKYLEFAEKYKKFLGPIGDYKKGEIEIIQVPALFPACEEGAVKIMIQAGISPEEAVIRSKIGVKGESRWGVTLCEPFRLPDGSYSTYVRFISWGALDSGIAGVVIVPVLSDGRLVFIKNFRHTIRKWCLEFPRGAHDPGETILKTLKKELSEEIAAEITEDPTKLGEVFPDSGVLASRVELFSVKIKLTGLKAEHEATEAIKGLVFMPKSDVKNLLKSQKYVDEEGKEYEFKDGFTLSALALLDPAA